MALDNATLLPGHSPFTAALLQHVGRSDLPLGLLIPSVTDSVLKDTKGRQARIRCPLRRLPPRVRGAHRSADPATRRRGSSLACSICRRGSRRCRCGAR